MHVKNIVVLIYYQENKVNILLFPGTDMYFFTITLHLGYHIEKPKTYAFSRNWTEYHASETKAVINLYFGFGWQECNGNLAIWSSSFLVSWKNYRYTQKNDLHAPHVFPWL